MKSKSEAKNSSGAKSFEGAKNSSGAKSFEGAKNSSGAKSFGEAKNFFEAKKHSSEAKENKKALPKETPKHEKLSVQEKLKRKKAWKEGMLFHILMQPPKGLE